MAPCTVPSQTSAETSGAPSSIQPYIASLVTRCAVNAEHRHSKVYTQRLLQTCAGKAARRQQRAQQSFQRNMIAMIRQVHVANARFNQQVHEGHESFMRESAQRQVSLDAALVQRQASLDAA